MQHPSFTLRSVALLAAGLLTGVAGCDREANGTTIEEVRDWPAAYMGQVVTAVGEVEDQHATGSFTLDGKGTWWNDEILVVVPREQAMTLERGSEVRVTGEVAQMVVTDVEREYGIDFDVEVETEYRDQPILIARNITLIDRD